MKEINAINRTELPIGRRGENLATRVIFDISDLEAEYGPGTVELIAQRPGDAVPYPVAVKRDGTRIIWEITSVDTAASTLTQSGKCEFRYYVGQVIVKSRVWRLFVGPAMDTPSETTPTDPEHSWVDQVLEVGASAKASAGAAKADADRVAALADNAVKFIAEVESNAVNHVQNTGNDQIERVMEEGGTQTANAKAQADAAAQSADSAAQSAQQAAESAAVYDTVASDVTQLKQDLSGLQTVVDSKADKTELAKTNLYLDALYKLNKGQTYDVLEQESEAYSVDVPSGAKYAGIDMVGGKSVVWNQLFPNALPKKEHGDGITVVVTDSEYICTVTQPRSAGGIWFTNAEVKTPNNHKIYAVCQTYSEKATTVLYSASTSSAINNVSANKWTKCSGIFVSNAGVIEIDVDTRTFEVGAVFKHRNFNFIDLTQMFGAGNEPSTVEEFEAMFPADYYPYSDPTIISSQTDRVEVASADGTITQQITTNFPILNSAGSVYDYIDLNEGKLYTWTYIEGNEVKALTEPVITDITIPTELTDWLTVETGGSITFHNTDEGKRLLIPNKLSFVRKLDEVTV